MTKFEKNKNYKIGKVDPKESQNDAIVWKGRPTSLPSEILISQCDGTFEDWVMNGDHNFKQGTLLHLCKIEDGVDVYVTEMTVPARNEDSVDSLADNPNYDFFAPNPAQNFYSDRAMKREMEAQNNKVIEVLENQLHSANDEIRRLNDEIARLKKESESGLSDNILNRVSREESEKRWNWEKENLNEKINSLSQRVKELEKENKGLSDEVIPQQQQAMFSLVAQVLPQLPSIWASFKNGGQAPAPQMVQGQQQAPNQTIPDSDLDGVPNG